ncbi:Alpha/Beta hydrolase protein [Mycena galopus ATCC 62051]|nr:Alpha/Beta hydrolase protein [Mycena galopus ATCC 62051]
MTSASCTGYCPSCRHTASIQNPAAADEIIIFLTGGPGCSSLVASLQENGLFLWQPATAAPFPNPGSWNKMTKYRRRGRLHDETDIAQEFLGCWQNFMKAFELQGRKVIVTGESYARYYPLHCGRDDQREGFEFFDVDAILMVDPIIGENDAQQ